MIASKEFLFLKLSMLISIIVSIMLHKMLHSIDQLNQSHIEIHNNHIFANVCAILASLRSKTIFQYKGKIILSSMITNKERIKNGYCSASIILFIMVVVNIR